jgi:transposase
MQLTELISTGRCAAAVLARARMLLKADASEGGPAWSDREIADALESSLSSVQRVRQAFVEAGLGAALERMRPTGGQYRKLDGAQEARLSP